MIRYTCHLTLIWAILCAVSSVAFGDEDQKLDPARPQIASLGEGGKAKIQEFYFPFLICQMGTVIGRSVDSVSADLKANLKKSALPLKAHYSKSGLSPMNLSTETFQLPPPVTAGSQLSGLADCNKEFCIMKLQTQKEKTVLYQSKEKLSSFHKIVINRIKGFIEKNELIGYENRVSNRDYVLKMIKKMPYFETAYPKCTKFLETEFWNKSTSSCNIVDSFIREEMVILADSILQPIMRVSEVFEFVENGKHLFFEIHIYTNHYFDSSARVYEVMPWKNSSDRSIAAITDFMEIDELTKSSVVRFLYLGKMQNAVSNYQGAELNLLK